MTHHPRLTAAHVRTHPGEIVLAQISDVHLGPIVGFSPRFWNFKRATGFLNWTRKRRDAYSRAVLDRIVADMLAQAPDHIAVTGDLINIGLPAEMDLAARWLSTLGPPDRVSVIPGNHDIYAPLGRDHGIARWQSYMTGETTDGAPFPYVRRIGPVALIGLNSAIETRPFVASGHLGGAQRRRLAALLERLGGDGIPRVVMIHHPPLPGQARPARGLKDAPALAEIIARHGAELVIHGHNHRNMLAHVHEPVRNRHVPIVGIPSGSMAKMHPREPLARYNLYRLTREAGHIAIELVGRGLAHPDGPVIELERRHLLGHAPEPAVAADDATRM